MPPRPFTVCRHPGCSRLTAAACGFCSDHESIVDNSQNPPRQQSALWRGNSASRGYDRRWRKARLVFLKANPLCAECRRQGRLNPATVVDHIIPHRGDKELFWNKKNWQPLCVTCHGKKTGSGC